MGDRCGGYGLTFPLLVTVACADGSYDCLRMIDDKRMVFRDPDRAPKNAALPVEIRVNDSRGNGVRGRITVEEPSTLVVTR
jgi:hypothetical protein